MGNEEDNLVEKFYLVTGEISERFKSIEWKYDWNISWNNIIHPSASEDFWE